MIRLNRTTEYGLMALKHMSQRQIQAPAVVTSAREVADAYGLPFEILAKTLQRLRDTGLIESAQGARGGYLLKRPLQEISLGEFLSLMEGPQTLMACAPQAESNTCEYHGKCEIKRIMLDLNVKFLTFLSGISLAELSAKEGKPLL